MNKKKKIVLICTLSIIGIIIVSGIFFFSGKKAEVRNMKNLTLHERQVEFLKEHQDEMTAYIKKELPGDNEIKYYWDSVKVVHGVLFENSKLYVQFDDMNHLVEDQTNKNKYKHRAIYIDTDLKNPKTINEMTLFFPYGEGYTGG